MLVYDSAHTQPSLVFTFWSTYNRISFGSAHQMAKLSLTFFVNIWYVGTIFCDLIMDLNCFSFKRCIAFMAKFQLYIMSIIFFSVICHYELSKCIIFVWNLISKYDWTLENNQMGHCVSYKCYL